MDRAMEAIRWQFKEQADRISTLERENAALKEALRFYADPPRGDPDVPIPDFYSELDFGERARKALETTL